MVRKKTDRPGPTLLQTPPESSFGIYEWAGLLLFAVAIGISLSLMGRVWWCDAGDLRPWSWDVWSRHNSQHLVDPYSLSHLQHGLGLYALLAVVAERWINFRLRTWIVAAIEAAWEVTENTDWMIQRYREATIALDYYGDGIANSLADYGACILGMLIARRLPFWCSIVLFAVLELASIWWIRDSLLLNVLMLLWPLEAIRQWQLGPS